MKLSFDFHVPRGIKAEGRRVIARPPAGAGDWERLRTDQRFFGLGKDKVHLKTVDRHPAVWQPRGFELRMEMFAQGSEPPLNLSGD